MEILLGLILIIGRLIYGSYQRNKADQYAEMVVRKHYKDK